MEREIELRSVADLGNQVAIAGKGCIIFDKQSRKPIHVVTYKTVFNITANKDKTLLALSTKKGILLHNIKTGKQYRPKDYIKGWNTFVAFSPLDDTLFSYCELRLFSYNSLNNQKTKENRLQGIRIKIPAKDFISCHPAKNEIIYISDGQELSIVQLRNDCLPTTTLTADFRCVSGDYAPDGHTIAILNVQNEQDNYFICNLEATENPLPARQLIFDDKNYCASKFHSHLSMIFLLSNDGYVHCFDYITRLFIAATKNLSSSTRLINDTWQRRRLDCDKEGKQIVTALADSWTVIDIPQNNFYAMWHLLCQKNLPRELRMLILHNILKAYKQSYEYFDLMALLDVTHIQPAKPEEKTEDPTVLETETKQIEAHYIRPMTHPYAKQPMGLGRPFI